VFGLLAAIFGNRLFNDDTPQYKPCFSSIKYLIMKVGDYVFYEFVLFQIKNINENGTFDLNKHGRMVFPVNKSEVHLITLETIYVSETFQFLERQNTWAMETLVQDYNIVCNLGSLEDPLIDVIFQKYNSVTA
jgi:hypothetical protein